MELFVYGFVTWSMETRVLYGYKFVQFLGFS